MAELLAACLGDGEEVVILTCPNRTEPGPALSNLRSLLERVGRRMTILAPVGKGPVGLQEQLAVAAGATAGPASDPARIAAAVAARAGSNGWVVVVLDADRLPVASLRYLRLLQRLTNVAAVRLQFVLVGQAALWARLEDPALDGLREVVRSRVTVPATDDGPQPGAPPDAAMVPPSVSMSWPASGVVDAAFPRAVGIARKVRLYYRLAGLGVAAAAVLMAAWLPWRGEHRAPSRSLVVTEAPPSPPPAVAEASVPSAPVPSAPVLGAVERAWSGSDAAFAFSLLNGGEFVELPATPEDRWTRRIAAEVASNGPEPVAAAASSPATASVDVPAVPDVEPPMTAPPPMSTPVLAKPVLAKPVLAKPVLATMAVVSDATVLRVTLQTPRHDADRERIERITHELRAEDIEVIQSNPTATGPAGLSVGYFFDQDLDAARAVIRALATSGVSSTPRLLTANGTPPPPGTIRVSLATGP